MMRLKVFLLPHGCDASPSQGYPSIKFTGTHSYASGRGELWRYDPWGPFLEAPGNFSIPDGSFKSFENCRVKVSAKETKWTYLEVRTRPTFLETLISKYDFGPGKLPGLSRNGPLARARTRTARYGVARTNPQARTPSHCPEYKARFKLQMTSLGLFTGVLIRPVINCN